MTSQLPWKLLSSFYSSHANSSEEFSVHFWHQWSSPDLKLDLCLGKLKQAWKLKWSAIFALRMNLIEKMYKKKEKKIKVVKYLNKQWCYPLLVQSASSNPLSQQYLHICNQIGYNKKQVISHLTHARSHKNWSRSRF